MCAGVVFSAVSSSAAVLANGAFVQSGRAIGGGTASVLASAGYGKPSATVVLSGAQVFAYAKATRQAKAAAVGSAQATAKGKYLAYGTATITGNAVMGAWVVQMQGSSYGTAGSANVVANATYEHVPGALLAGNAAVVANPYAIRKATALVAGSGSLRVESKVNNQLDGYALPGALSTLTLNAQGVVVAPVISHFDGSSDIQASPTYVHRAKAISGTAAEITATALYNHQAVVELVTASHVAAEAHWKWAGEAEVVGTGFGVEAFPAHLHRVSLLVQGTNDLAAQATYIQQARAMVDADSSVAVVEPLITRYAAAAVMGGVLINSSPATVGSPATRDPEERTMHRPFTNRTMQRPFVDRVMKAKRV